MRGVLTRNGIHCIVVAERRGFWRTLVEAVPMGKVARAGPKLAGKPVEVGRGGLISRQN